MKEMNIYKSHWSDSDFLALIGVPVYSVSGKYEHGGGSRVIRSTNRGNNADTKLGLNWIFSHIPRTMYRNHPFGTTPVAKCCLLYSINSSVLYSPINYMLSCLL